MFMHYYLAFSLIAISNIYYKIFYSWILICQDSGFPLNYLQDLIYFGALSKVLAEENLNIKYLVIYVRYSN